MKQFDKRKMVTTRKVHKCTGCMKEIPKGEEAVYHSGKVDDGFYKYYLHLECHQYMVKWKHYFDEGVWDGCVNDIKREVSTLSFFDENNI